MAFFPEPVTYIYNGEPLPPTSKNAMHTPATQHQLTLYIFMWDAMYLYTQFSVLNLTNILHMNGWDALEIQMTIRVVLFR